MEIDWSSVVNNLISSTIFFLGGIIFVGYIFKNVINKKIVFYLKSIINRTFNVDQFKKVDIDTTLNELTDSIEHTSQFFLRIGRFDIGTEKYNRAISKIIIDEDVWDYHIHLQSRTSHSKHYYSDYFEIQNNKIISVKPVSTSELIEMKRMVFDKLTEELFAKYNIDSKFVDIIIKGVIERTKKYPKLKDIDYSKVSISRIHIFYLKNPIQLPLNLIDDFTNELLSLVSKKYEESIYIPETPKDENDKSTLEIGKRMMNFNKS